MGKLIDVDRLKEVFSRNVVGGNAYFDLIDAQPTVEAIPKADYENRLKADLKAILVELQLEIEEKKTDYDKDLKIEHDIYHAYNRCSKIIQQKINELKGENDDNVSI